MESNLSTFFPCTQGVAWGSVFERLTRSGELMSDTCLSNQLSCRDWLILCESYGKKNNKKKQLTLWHLMGLFSNINLCQDFLWNHEHSYTHTSDNGITSSVWRLIVLDSDECGMSRNTFSFPLRGKAVRGGKLPGINGLCPGEICRVGWREWDRGWEKGWWCYWLTAGTVIKSSAQR